MKSQKLKSITACLLVFILASWSKHSNAQWSLTGNAGTNASTNFIGTTDNVAFKIRTKNLVRLTVSSSGKVGIGITTPVFKLDVKGGSINTDSLYRINGNAVLSVKGTSNLFAGVYAGKSNTTGGQNTAIGTSALTNNTTGTQNTAIGNLTMLSNTSGVNNTACGNNSLLINTVGFANAAFGHQSLYNNTEGSENTATGALSLTSNTTGFSNTANGVSALVSNTEGYNNVAVGYHALYSNQIAGGLVAVGAGALLYSTGYGNTAVGSNALYATTTGGANTAVGRSALGANTTGQFNTAVGDGANVTSPSLTWATAIGAGAQVGCSSCLVLGSGGTRVGIDTQSPSAKLSIGSNLVELTGTVLSNTFRTNAGNLSGFDGSTLSLGNFGFKSTNNSSLGIRAYRYTDDILSPDWTTTAILVSYDVDNSYNAGNTTNYLAFSGTGNIGIGTPYPGYLLDVNGTAAKPGGGSWIASSDARLKQNVQPYNDGLASLLKINPVTYHYNEKSGYDTKPEYVGVIAQELKEIAPYMVSTFKNKDNEEYYGVNNSAMTYMLINAIKELNTKVQQLENSLSQCCASFENNNLKNETNNAFADDKPFLAQNQPNPFSKQSVIRYYVPGFITSAKIMVTDISGQPLKSFEINKPGYGEINIQAGELAAGSYLYSLIIDGIKTESRRMELVK